MIRAAILVVPLTLLTTSCRTLAVWSAPDKTPKRAEDPQTESAHRQFWEALHAGDYERIPEAISSMTAAYLEHPDDPVVAARVGWLHIWTLAEIARIPEPNPRVTEHATLARRYFAEAVRLNPDEARYRGFLAGAMMTEGTIHKDEKLVREGYFEMMDAVSAWPEFNDFTAGYVMSRAPADTDRYADAVEYQWKNLDECYGVDVDRENFDLREYLPLEVHEGQKRVCWNSEIAPHNVEGFLLNMGDMIVKAGNWQLGVQIYENAKHSAGYATWSFKSVLERRISEAERNVARFRKDDGTPRHRPNDPQTRMMVNSSFACMGCHQN